MVKERSKVFWNAVFSSSFITYLGVNRVLNRTKNTCYNEEE